MLLSNLYIMWPIHLQSLKLLRLKVLEEMHLHETGRTYVHTYVRTDRPKKAGIMTARSDTNLGANIVRGVGENKERNNSV